VTARKNKGQASAKPAGAGSLNVHRHNPPDQIRQGARSPVFRRIKPRRAFDEISNEIKQMIFSGVLKPGSRLPSENELANQFGVGRQTIREALRLLELSGFVIMRKGGAGGPVIVDTILNTLANSFLDIFRMGRITIDELTTARTEVEKIVLVHAFRNLEDSDIHALQDNVQKAHSKLKDGIQAFEENVQFHKLLAKASKNHVFVAVMESIITMVAHFRSLLGADLALSERATFEHAQILDAIVKRQKKRGLELLEKHLLYIDGRFKEFSEEQAVLNSGDHALERPHNNA
jgi:GntR family transcriptional regulator, transcriptional repressor for pyruvate dehydrogenase complex